MRQILYAFDLDDTLIKSESKVDLIRNGEHIELTPSEYAHYINQEGDIIDFKQFNEIKGQFDKIGIVGMLEYFTEKLKDSLIDTNIHVAIVTARGSINFTSVLEFFEFYFRYILQYNLDLTQRLLKKIEFKGLHSSDPEDKKEHIEGYITGDKLNLPGMDEIHFFDDSIKNVRAVYSLSPDYPNTKVYSYFVHEGKATLYDPFGMGNE